MFAFRRAVAFVLLLAGLAAAWFADPLSTSHGEDKPATGARQPTFSANDWPWWRGPHNNGAASADPAPPTQWSDTENVIWKADVPGRGHGSPTVVGNQVFLASADHDREVQLMLCFDRKTGIKKWETVVHRGGFEKKKGNGKSTLASSTAACDGERIYINFLHDGAIHTTALNREGHILWQTKVADYLIHQGFGSSPAIYGSLVYVSADSKGDGMIAALDRSNGKVAWKRHRPKNPNYASPIILHIHGRDQLVMTGCDLVTSFDPETGMTLWEIEGATTECVTSTVTDGKHIFTSGGYPKNHLAAVAADGSGKVVWENTSRVYVPSLLIRDGHLYGVLDAGVAVCWKSDTGEELWKHRLGGTFSSSPVLAGENVYATDESGRTVIFKAKPDGYEEVAENKLGDDVFATPTICGGRIYHRVARMVDGKRRETLYCLGK